MLSNPNLAKSKGEGFCWHAAWGIRVFVDGYMAYKDTTWLDSGVRYFDWLIAKMDKSPDGYKGWVGPYMYDSNAIADCHVGDGVIMAEFARFIELVYKDAGLKAKYGNKADEYLGLIRKDFIEKWDKRGTWIENLVGAEYIDLGHQTETYTSPEKFGQKIDNETRKFSIPFNKQFVAGLIYLRLYRATNEAFYRERAEKIFTLFKSRVRFYDDRYVWNYWEPLSPFDVTDKSKHWVGVHPRAGYNVLETEGAIEAYHTGVVFNQKDMERIVATNLWMWNKDKENPKFKSADGGCTEEGSKEWGPGGTLWPSVISFNADLREAYVNGLEKAVQKSPNNIISKTDLAYLKETELKEPASFKRKYAKEEELKIPDIPVYPMRDIVMAACFPDKVKAGDTVKAVVKINPSDSKLKIDLYDASGKTLIKNLFDFNNKKEELDGLTNFYVKEWKTDGLKGDYKVRCSYRESYKDIPIRIE